MRDAYDLKYPIVFDIETVSNEKADEYFKNRTYSAPSNYKNEDKIKEAIEEKRLKDKEKAALHWWTGKIICISAYNIIKEHKTFYSGFDEKKILCDFFDMLNGEPFTYLVGKNSKSFDIPFIVGRAMAHDIGLPVQFRDHTPRTITDVDNIFSYSSACDQVTSLDNYAFGLGIAGKTMSAKSVADYYIMAGLNIEAWNTIKEYCDHDVMITSVMFTRFSKRYISEKQPILKGLEDDIEF